MNEVIVIYAVTLLLAWPLGGYIAGVFDGCEGAGARVFLPVEKGLYRLAGVDPSQPMSWQGYGKALLKLHLVLALIVFGLLMAQGVLFLNPDAIGGMSWDLALHTAISFLTNTNQQHYSGQAQLSYLAHTFGIVALQVITPAAGMAALIAIVRTLLGRPDRKAGSPSNSPVSVGNFYQDITRAIVRIMLPIATVIALMLASQGVPNSYEGAQRQKTPSELALSVLLAAMTLIFLIVVVTLAPLSGFVGIYPSYSVLVALLVCLIPTTIGGLLPAIGIAGMDRGPCEPM